MTQNGRWQDPSTEAINPDTLGIDTMPVLDIIDLIGQEDRKVVSAVHRERTAIAHGVELLVDVVKRGGKIFFVGAGTSGRLGVIEATEMPSTFGTPPSLVQAVMAGGQDAVFKTREGVEDNFEEGARSIPRLRVSKRDVVIGVSASGFTPFVRGALIAARKKGARIIFVTCQSGSEMETFVDLMIAPAVGPEVIAGSTRLKAGTATKMVLNMLTTIAMIRIGKTYGNLMVDVQTGSEQRRRRACRIVAEVTGLDRLGSVALLKRAKWNVKAALVMQQTQVTYAQAVLRLKKADDSVTARSGAIWRQRSHSVADSPDAGFALTRSVLAAGLAARAFPAAAIEVGRTSGHLWRTAVGRLRYDADSPAATPETIFDLASLTKVIATTSFAMRQIAAGRIEIDTPVAQLWPRWHDEAHQLITIRHLLDHSSGLPAHGRYWETARGRDEYEAAIHAARLDRPVGSAAVYSDLGFMALGFLLADLGGPLEVQMAELARELGTASLGYQPAETDRDSIAPTEFDMWRNRLLIGEVHDENAAALDGIAGHAGLFGPVGDVGIFARVVLQTFREQTVLGDPDRMQTFARRSTVPGSSRALGWDTMLPTSSCGSRLSPHAIGHTGFTGTSLWIDPAQDLYVALVTNRVHPSRANEGLRAIRPKVHDAVVEDLR